MVRMRRGAILLLLGLATLAAVLAFAVLAILATLAPGDAVWTLPLRVTAFGRPLERTASVPVLLRLATHPLAAPVIDARHVDTAHGRWQLAAGTAEGLVATCAPCRIAATGLGPAPLLLERVQLAIRADGADQYHGTLRLGLPPQVLALTWRGRIDRSGHMRLDAALPATPLQDVVQAFGAALPERASVQVEGTLWLELSARLPDGPWRVAPRVEGFAVQGLGTESLLDLQRPAACRDGSEASVTTVTGWLPRAVVAAEDQRFFDHPGYDLTALTDAWLHNQQRGSASEVRPGGLIGASTLTQQLAKLVITGDDRSAARKLRELLYAVEMERTLGKARILQLYLALAPWGEGVCGAERAVRVHLGQRNASAIGPVAAAWLASLLPQPDALLHGDYQRGEIDADRVGRVLEAMRPMAKERRDKALAAMPVWLPPALARPREGLPAHSPVATP
jgi:Transglycosylase